MAKRKFSNSSRQACKRKSGCEKAVTEQGISTVPQRLTPRVIKKSKRLAKLFTEMLGVGASASWALRIIDLDQFCANNGLEEAAGLVGVHGAFAGFVQGMRPRDPLEKLALEQLLLNHVRVLGLSQQASMQSNPEMIKILNESADRASGAFRRLMAAFAEYRKPGQQSIVAIGQATIARSPVSQNVQDLGREPQKKKSQTN